MIKHFLAKRFVNRYLRSHDSLTCNYVGKQYGRTAREKYQQFIAHKFGSRGYSLKSYSLESFLNDEHSFRLSPNMILEIRKQLLYEFYMEVL